MSYTKQQFIEAAFEELGLASYVFDLQADQLQSAKRRLDSIIAMWASGGVDFTTYPADGDLDTDTTIPTYANQAVIFELAIQLAPMHGKQVAMETRRNAKKAYNVMYSTLNVIPSKQYPDTLPVGAGNKPWRGDAGEYFNPTTTA